MVRIIGGGAKGCRLFMPRHSRVRPTTGRVKESLFNILGPLENKSFLDLFAGTGSIGIEALSRGAANSVFIEKDPVMVEALKRNLRKCGFESRGEVMAMTVAKGVSLLERRGTFFDIAFADPPYGEGYVDGTLRLLSRGALLAPGGVVVVQHSLKEEFPACPENMVLIDQRRYGDTGISVFTGC
ncbi:MAG: 16S rRNA (guanine(966)-N(2))-methyltransferase RsmD [Syntrophales bacterium]